MGSKLSTTTRTTRRKPRVEEQYTRPSGLYPTVEVDVKRLRKLIMEGKLAPCYPGVEEGSSDRSGVALEECPICFLSYPGLNRCSCCGKGLCTECFIQIKTPPPNARAQCPFCKVRGYTVRYQVRSVEDQRKDRAEQQRVLEAQIRAREEEQREAEERRKSRTDQESSQSQDEQAAPFGVTPEVYTRIMGGSLDAVMRSRTVSSSSQRRRQNVLEVEGIDGPRRIDPSEGELGGSGPRHSQGHRHAWTQRFDTRILRQLADHVPEELLRSFPDDNSSFGDLIDAVDLEEILLAQAVLHSLEDMGSIRPDAGQEMESRQSSFEEDRLDTQLAQPGPAPEVVESGTSRGTMEHSTSRPEVEVNAATTLAVDLTEATEHGPRLDDVSNEEEVPDLSPLAFASVDGGEDGSQARVPLAENASEHDDIPSVSATGNCPLGMASSEGPTAHLLAPGAAAVRRDGTDADWNQNWLASLVRNPPRTIDIDNSLMQYPAEPEPTDQSPGLDPASSLQGTLSSERPTTHVLTPDAADGCRDGGVADWNPNVLARLARNPPIDNISIQYPAQPDPTQRTDQSPGLDAGSTSSSRGEFSSQLDIGEGADSEAIAAYVQAS
mmetsp:Transcript_6647/g.24661  ORF Transcript_6647/g.24661 Transcript_6647/m.24661 type:complete len:608 (-) Transcript_6647:1138-2961(-)